MPSPHLVEPSPWPLFASLGALGLTGGSVMYWHFGKSLLLQVAVLTLLFSSYCWWEKVSMEKTKGYHNTFVVSGLRSGVILFMVSEIMFFFSFFWAFFSKCLNPEGEIGYFWPPLMFDFIIVDPFSIPLLNSVLLLSSGATMTCAHHFILDQKKGKAALYLGFTVLLGVVFLGLQVMEYAHSMISINSSIYGSVFFLLTGFHGFHVTMGAIFLFICLLHKVMSVMSKENHTGFEAAAWYWHFVDVVWLFLYFFVYWYGFNA